MKPRIGRPRSKLAKPRAEVTVRVRKLLDLAHEGNVHEASLASGIPYATIRDLYTGRSTNPSLMTLQKLAKAYGTFAGWFTGATQSDEVYIGGYVTRFPGFVHGERPHLSREVMIPFAAYPLPRLYEQLADELEKLPTSPSRPIVGESVDPVFGQKVAEFLLRPLLDEEAVSGRELILDAAPVASAGAWRDPEQRAQYVRRLRLLGRFWEADFPALLEGIRTQARIPRVSEFARP
jgi:transcriptional regulator with XRE-family HTH domain